MSRQEPKMTVALREEAGSAKTREANAKKIQPSHPRLEPKAGSANHSARAPPVSRLRQ